MHRHALLAAAFASAAATPALAQSDEAYPARPMRIVVGFTPGTTTDITARLLADRLSERFGQTVVVDNRPGAASGIANQLVSRATPDGHTMLIGTLALATAHLLHKKPPFDPKDLQPVSLVVLAANVISVYPQLPAKTLGDLIKMAKAQPGKLRYGSSGRGSSAFMTLELLKSMADIDMQEIPYKATSQAVADAMSGQIQVYPPNIVSAIPMLRSGRLRPLAVTSAKRAPALPDVPAVSEFVPGYDATTGIYGILMPTGTPADRIATMEKALIEIARDPRFKDKLEGDGGVVVAGTGKEYADYIQAQRVKWKTLFDKIGVVPQ